MPGCTTIVVAPPIVEEQAASEKLALPALYRGDPRHLPHHLVAAPTPDAPFEYSYEVSYARVDSVILALLNPLTILGFPVGKAEVTALAKLDARRAGAVVKTYRATSVVTQTQSLYSSDSLTELRRQALAAARESIDAQIGADRSFLEDLQQAAATPSASP